MEVTTYPYRLWKKWGIADDEQLIKLREKGVDYHNIAEQMNRSYHSVVNRAYRIGLCYKRRTIQNWWKEEDDKKLIGLKKQNYTNREIAKMMDRSVGSIKKRASVLNITSPINYDLSRIKRIDEILIKLKRKNNTSKIINNINRELRLLEQRYSQDNGGNGNGNSYRKAKTGVYA